VGKLSSMKREAPHFNEERRSHWIMSTIVAGIFGLVIFAWWKGREGGVDEAGKELIRIISCSNESMFEPGREAGATEYYITDDPFK